MKQYFKWLSASLCVALSASQAQAADDTAHKEKALAAIHVFQSSLKAELMKAMREGGPEAAIIACKVEAPKIAEQTAMTQGLEIGRTSLKVRNPNNAPDAWELSVLKAFEASRAGREPIGSLEASSSNGTVYRYMKAIPTQHLCTACHGTDIDPELYAKIKASYPEDTATGFSFGDIRGAFTVSIPLGASSGTRD